LEAVKLPLSITKRHTFVKNKVGNALLEKKDLTNFVGFCNVNSKF